MSHDPFAPTPAFLEWLDSLPPTPKVILRRKVEAKEDRAEKAEKREADIIAVQQRIAAEKAAKKLAGDGRTKRGRKAKVQEVYPNSRVHLMEDSDEE